MVALYIRTLSRHLLPHMLRSLSGTAGVLAGVGRAMVEKGFELMQMRGRSFFSTGRWPLGTRPKTSSKQSEGMVVPRSLVGGDTKGLGCWLLYVSVADKQWWWWWLCSWGRNSRQGSDVDVVTAAQRQMLQVFELCQDGEAVGHQQSTVTGNGTNVD